VRCACFLILLSPSAIFATDRLAAPQQKTSKVNSDRIKVELGRSDPESAPAHNDRGEEFRKKREFDRAIEEYSAAIRLDPTFTWPYNNRGLTWTAKGEFDKALKDFAEALRLDPKYSFPYNNRGLVWAAKGEWDNAINDYSRAINLDGRYLFAHWNRGVAWEVRGEISKAIADYAESIQIDPNYAPPYNSIAWLRATYHDARYRAGKEAVEYATKACELTNWKSYAEIDTLAAAYAEAGEFTNAVIRGMTALELAPENEKAHVSERLELFRSNQPYRQPVKQQDK